jgi:hypothetical protein
MATACVPVTNNPTNRPINTNKKIPTTEKKIIFRKIINAFRTPERQVGDTVAVRRSDRGGSGGISSIPLLHLLHPIFTLTPGSTAWKASFFSTDGRKFPSLEVRLP